MSLRLELVAEQVAGAVGQLEASAEERHRRLAEALRTLEAWGPRTDVLGARILAAQNTSWTLAEPLEPLDTRRAAPSIGPYVALATDGSHIDVDRSQPLACSLINVGGVRLPYGVGGAPALTSTPELAAGDGTLLPPDPDDVSREAPVRGNLLAALRSVRELERLAELAEDEGEEPAVCLLDGVLTVWGVSESRDGKAAVRRVYEHGAIPALGRFRALAQRRRVALGAYISYPALREVLNTLRVAVCPLDVVDCPRCPGKEEPPRPCDSVAGGTDRDLFARVLGAGQRSALFRRVSRSREDPATKFYASAGHAIAFFYVKVPLPHGTGEEVARVETPEWLAGDPGAVDLLHGAVLDQCSRGMGYPVALMEAHEQAVISGPERESFRQLLQRATDRPETGMKAYSKRLRYIG